MYSRPLSTLELLTKTYSTCLKTRYILYSLKKTEVSSSRISNMLFPSKQAISTTIFPPKISTRNRSLEICPSETFPPNKVKWVPDDHNICSYCQASLYFSKCYGICFCFYQYSYRYPYWHVRYRVKKCTLLWRIFAKGKEGIPHIPTYFDINLSLKIEFIIKWTLSLWTQYNSTPHRAGEKGRRVKEGTKEMPQQQNNLKNFLIFPCWPRTHMRRRATSVKETPTEWQSQSVWLTEEQTR